MRGHTAIVLSFMVLGVPIAHFFGNGDIANVLTVVVLGGIGLACLGWAASPSQAGVSKLMLGSMSVGLFYGAYLVL